ncbi:hypothetical protein BG003_010876 [Podila horticola]|nr:hypothetical protein BG003_010876 [Podila horticola]
MHSWKHMVFSSCEISAWSRPEKLLTVENMDEDDDDDYQDGDDGGERIDKLEEYGLRQDCSVFEGMASYAEYVAGSTIEAAALLAEDAFDVIVHWDGGRHHAQKDRAEGFCYISDIVLGIMELQKGFPKVMYIDLDVHHGDGVENAFQFSDKVLTVSLHHFAEGFYPGTGNGKPPSPRSKAVVNIPLKSGLSDGNLIRIFDGMIEPLKETFSPDAIVLQCGVDGMAGDTLGKWNLGLDGYGHCLKAILSWKKPLIVLGGGGYKNSSAARCYAYLTSVILERDISDDIPEHEYFEDYAPDFQLQVEPGRQPDENTKEYLNVMQVLDDHIPYLESKVAIVTGVSTGLCHEFVSGVDIELINDPTSVGNTGANTASIVTRYGRSKLYNILSTKALARKLENESVYTNVDHLGTVHTEFARNEVVDMLTGAVFFYDAKAACLTQVYCAISPEIVNKGIRGRYFIPIANELRPNSAAEDVEAQEALWAYSERLIQDKSPASRIKVN